MRSTIRHYLFAAASLLVLASCTTADLYEKTVTIPGHAWANSFRPSFEFTIKDTTSPYMIYLVLRHNEKYNYNNIYINMYVQVPGHETMQKIQRDLPLATQDTWKGTGMDDIYEHRIELDNAANYLKAGEYKFTLEQIMREDPLQNVLDVGIRVEKK